jgi:phosphotransferase system enzyme I (PtsI)
MSRKPVSETVLEGLPLSGGVAVARACRFNENRHSNMPMYKIDVGGVDEELERVKRAVSIVVDKLQVMHDQAVDKIGAAEAEIFTVQKMIVEDEAVHKEISELISGQRTNAEAAVMVVLDSYEARIRNLENEYLAERASDIGEVKRRILDVLANINPEFQCASQEYCQRGSGRVVIAQELTPGMTMELDTANTLGFVTERGGVNSHAAILARALGIPAVSGVSNVRDAITCGTEVIVNGNSGQIIIAPTEETLARVREEEGESVKAPGPIEPTEGFEVLANMSLSTEVSNAVNMMAEGIGLYRTEFEFMAEGRALNEDEQFERYASVVEKMAGKPVTFRLFDAGGDKPLPFLDIPPEDNPALGWRGARLLLGHSHLLKTQARALARASEIGPVKVLYPMVIDLAQFIELRTSFQDAIADLPSGNLQHGVMFEVPSACLDAESILEEADFGSIGTNDLIQYLFAVDRNNELVAHDYSLDRPMLWTVIEQIAQAAAKTGKPISVCGEMAGDPKYVPRLRDVGITSVSVSSRLIPGVRAVMKSTEK